MSSSPQPAHRSPLPPLHGVLRVLRLVRSEPDLGRLLPRIAAVVAESLGFRSVAINLFRPGWDDFEVAAVHGSDEARATLLGTTTSSETWHRLLHDRFRRGDVYFVPRGEPVWDGFAATYVPPLAAAADPGAWHPEDALLAPLYGTGGDLLGILSLDEPESGRVPGEPELEVLAAVAEHVALAVEAAQSEAAAAGIRESLTQLLEVSSRLGDLASTDSLLDAVAHGIQRALGFEKVCVAIAEPGGGFTPAGSAGWDELPAALEFSLTTADLAALLDPAFEVEGCYLLANEEANARVGNRSPYASQRNGRGPRAWNRHWLIVPLFDRHGEPRGFVWADDPADNLLPSRERLQALRTFANQAAAALDAALDFDQLGRRNGELAALHRTTLSLLDRLDLDSVLSAIVESAASLLGTPHGYLYLVDDERRCLRMRVRLGLLEQLKPSEVAAGEGLSGRVWESGRSLAVEDYRSWESRLASYREATLSAVVGVPLRSGSEVRGVLGLAYEEPGRSFGPAEVALLERFAQLASLALENARLYDEVRRSEELHRRVLKHSHDLIALVDLEGRIVYANPSHERVLGYPLDELIGMEARALADPNDPPLELSGGAPPMATRRLRRKDGTWAQLEGSTVLLRSPSGEPELALVFARDVTERERLQEQLRQAQKMESIGRLAGGIAHDFNNLLTAIGGYAELSLLELEAGDIAGASGSVGQIARASRRAAELTTQLLAFSRKQVLHPRALDLNDVVSETASMLARMLGDDVVLATELEPCLGTTLADPAQVEQVLLNLAINARDAMPDGGSLSLRTANLEFGPDETLPHPDVRPGSYVALVVRDTGAGMPPELAQRIFEPFFTTKKVGEGTGLGLATVHGIVSQSGGAIWVESEPGEGSCFTVCLPRVAAAELADTAAA